MPPIAANTVRGTGTPGPTVTAGGVTRGTEGKVPHNRIATVAARTAEPGQARAVTTIATIAAGEGGPESVGQHTPAVAAGPASHEPVSAVAAGTANRGATPAVPAGTAGENRAGSAIPAVARCSEKANAAAIAASTAETRNGCVATDTTVGTVTP